MAECRFRVLQHNLGKGKVATAELRQQALHIGASVLLVQEPWTGRHFVCGMGTTSNLILVGTTEERPRACIVVLDNTLDVVSMYCPPSPPEDVLENHLHQIQLIHDTVRGVPTILGMDANALSPTWGASRRNNNGRLLEELVATLTWDIANIPGIPTFQNKYRSSYIDVTLISQNLSRYVSGWNVRQGWTQSDHNVIEIALQALQNLHPTKSDRFNVLRADWASFVRRTEEAIVDMPLDFAGREDVEALAERITVAIQDAAQTSIPRKRRRPRSVPWWTPELTRWKRICYASRRHFQREQDAGARDIKYAAYRRIRREYTRRI